jgi:hypothetical protein
MSAPAVLPRWADVALLPVVCLAIALLASGGVVALVGQNPTQVLVALMCLTHATRTHTRQATCICTCTISTREREGARERQRARGAYAP